MLRLVINAKGTNLGSYSEKALMEARMRTKCSIRYLLAASMIVLTFSGIDCRRNPVGPPPGADTTSHNFTFTQYEFGGGPSYFNDVAIVNDSDIWVVGTINAATDSMYNAVHWDGASWQLARITVQTKYGLVTAPFYGIYAFSGNDIWILSGLPIHGDGKVWTQYDLYGMGILGQTDGYLTGGWGRNSSDVFFIGTKGTIVHYSNGVWTKMVSGTTIDLRDVWGSADGSVVWACGYSNDNSQSILLKCNGVSWKTVWTRQGGVTPPYGDLITSLWGEKHLFTSTNYGVYSQDISGADTATQVLAINNFPYRIRSGAENNIAVVGDNGTIWHYNGSTWKLLNYVGSGVPLYSVAVTDNMIVAAGADFTVTTSFPPKALIYIGYRSK